MGAVGGVNVGVGEARLDVACGGSARHLPGEVSNLGDMGTCGD